MRRTALLVPLALAVGATTMGPSNAASIGTTPTFGVPRIVDPIHVYGEPNLEVNPKTGAIHATGPQGTGTQRSIWNVSVDGGDSYRIVQNLPANTAQLENNAAIVPSKSALGAGGGDTEIKIAHNGRTFFNDLAALASFTAVTTTDDGATTSVANPAAIGFPGGDRQWMALFDPQPSDRTISPYTGPKPLNYMEYQDTLDADAVDMTTDGTTYTVAGSYADDNMHSANHGVPLVDQHTGRFLGLTSGKSGANSLALVVGVPNAAGLLTFHYNEIVSGLPGSPQTLFPVLAQDGARNLYAVWIDKKTFQASYSWAAPGVDNEWKTWSAPRQLSKAPANVNVFPWVTAGKAPGIIDVAWYGTNQTLAQLGTAGPSAKKDQTWQLFFSQVSKANTPAPAIAQVIAAPHPMHYNDICLLGTACITGQGNRNQADFFKMVIDPMNGRARIIFTDSSNRLSQTVNMDSAADHQGAALDDIITQNTGLSALTGKPLAPYETTAPITGITDPAGDSLLRPLGGTYVPGADILGLGVAKSGSNLVFTVKTKAPLSGAAAAGKTATAQLTVRWQMGDTLYFASAQETPAGTTQYFGGKTASVDLCSVSGCKPNYLTYPAYPSPGVVQADGSNDGGAYKITVPLSAIGNPTAASLLEQVMGFVTVNPEPVVQNNVTNFFDQAPLQLEGTKTFNYRFGAKAVTAPSAPLKPVAPPTAPKPSGGTGLAATGLSTTVPLAALLLLVGGTLLARRRRV